MKNYLVSSFVFLVLISFSCSREAVITPILIVTDSSLEAAISFDESCTSTINFEDLDSNVYGYRADAVFAKPVIQTGGHSTIDEATDLGFNLFFDPNNLGKTNYKVDGTSEQVGTAYVFSIIGGTEYISSDANTSNLMIERLGLDADGRVEVLVASFNNVEVVNNANPSDVRCINNFRISFFN